MMAGTATLLWLAVTSAIAADPAASLPKIIRGAPVVTVARPLVRNSADFDFLGTIEPAAAVELRAPISGRVAKVHVAEGADVAAGDVLIELDRAALQDELKSAEAVVERRKAAVAEFAKKLSQSNLKKADRAVLLAQRDLAQSQVWIATSEADRARKQLDMCDVRAPAAGRVRQFAVRAGDRVIADIRSATLLGVLQPTNPVLVTFDVDEATCLRWRKARTAQGQKVESISDLSVAIAMPGERGFKRKASVQYAGPRIDPQTGTAAFQAALPNVDGELTAALFAPERERELGLVRLTIGVSTPLYLVPNVAVGTDAEGNRFVLVVNERNVVEWRAVTVAGSQVGMVSISDGLTADDRVVIAAERAVNNAPNVTLSPDDFATDIRLVRVRPGQTVSPVEIKLPDPDAPVDGTQPIPTGDLPQADPPKADEPAANE